MEGNDDLGVSPEMRTINLAEIVAATMTAVNNSRVAEIALQDVVCLIPSFSASEGEDVEQWIRRITSVENTYQVDSSLLLLAVIKKLEGRALKWFHSRPEYAELRLSQLKDKLKSVFACEEDTVTLLRRFQARKWKGNEPFSDYYHEKLILGNKLNIHKYKT